MKRILFASTVLTTIAVAGPLLAADFSPSYKAPVAAGGMNWTGCYVGISGGGGVVFNSNTGATTIGSGGFFGGQGGCNYQINSFVAGIEGEGFWSDIKGRSDFIFVGPGGGGATSTITTNSFYDVAVRFGFTFFDRTLLYGKVGAVWSNQSFAYSDSGGGTASASWTSPGVLIGSGFEYAITNNWIARFETDAMYFNGTDVTFTANNVNNSVIATSNSLSFVSKIGLSYKFW